MAEGTEPADVWAVLDADRTEQGLSYAELARRAGVKPSTTYDVLTGRRPDPQLSTLLALLAGLARDLAWLHRRGVRPEPGANNSPL